ncbi:MAG: hypothetical protein WCK65_00125 [Rhodospirillaceae bacterium]
MDHLDAALKRLAKAAERLEVAAESREHRFDKERTGLSQTLQNVRAEQARTVTATEGVSTRLEGAIERLNAVLER